MPYGYLTKVREMHRHAKQHARSQTFNYMKAAARGSFQCKKPLVKIQESTIPVAFADSAVCRGECRRLYSDPCEGQVNNEADRDLLPTAQDTMRLALFLLVVILAFFVVVARVPPRFRPRGRKGPGSKFGGLPGVTPDKNGHGPLWYAAHNMKPPRH
ncbi:hypothetical protein Ae201684P_008010 [Aphanomyces euteiches]|uniref:Uncharacterized protein n=1 Tax=Aphanomyces euteiches TaxID=100861 RepID=A0A6G0WMD5_9STRA|nr:hypothetical protein Ae201684_013817 [Aphanomyces euteiches]KAH9080924.1 hypothetical protein Ae201684P_008010 [Aphanomyces euteiches]